MPKTLPSHSSCLHATDFVPYLAGSLRVSAYQRMSLDELWGNRLARTLIPTPSGRHALWYFLELCRNRLNPGDEVIVAGYNFYVIIRVLIQWGLVPVFADIEPGTLCLDAAQIDKTVTSRTRLVVVTHMFGHPAAMQAIRSVCQQHDLLLFEDCAHAVGTLGADGLQMGQYGEGALFSFGIHKIINTFGGGMLAVMDELVDESALPDFRTSRRESFLYTFSRFIASAMMHPSTVGWVIQPTLYLSRLLAQKGWPGLSRALEPARDNPSYRFVLNERAPFKDFMRRMMAMQLDRLEDNIQRRRAVRQQIREGLAHVEEIGWLDEDAHGRSNAAYFGIRVPSPAALSEFLIERGVMTNPREFYDCSRLTQFAQYAAVCPHSAHASDHILRLPSYPYLTPSQSHRIVAGIEAYFARPVTRA